MISRQLTSGAADYGLLKPVYSVWIILNDIPKALQYSRYEVSLTGISSLQKNAAFFSQKQKSGYDRAVRKLDSQIDMLQQAF